MLIFCKRIFLLVRMIPADGTGINFNWLKSYKLYYSHFSCCLIIPLKSRGTIKRNLLHALEKIFGKTWWEKIVWIEVERTWICNASIRSTLLTQYCFCCVVCCLLFTCLEWWRMEYTCLFVIKEERRCW